MSRFLSHAPTSGPSIAGFVPTPFAREDIDERAIAAQAAYLGRHGVIIGLLGGMGEFYSVSPDEAERLTAAAVAGAGGGAPVLVGIGFATREAATLAHRVARAGAHGLVINPPYYVAPRPAAFADHVRRVTEAAGLGAVIYSSKFTAMDDTYLEALSTVPLAIAIKEEVASPEDVAVRHKQWGDRYEWWTVGEHGSRPYLEAGCTTVTSGLANLAAPVSFDLVSALPSACSLQVLDAWTTLRGRAAGCEIALYKTMLSEVRGWPAEVRLPNSPISSEVALDARRLAISLAANQ